MRKLISGLFFLAAFSTSGATQAPQAHRRDGLRRGAAHCRRRRRTDREFGVHRRQQSLHAGRQTWTGERAGRRGARRSDRQDGHAGDRRHAHAHAGHARRPRRLVAAEGVLRRRRRHEPRPGYGRCGVPGPGRNHSRRRSAAHRGTRDHDAGAGADRGAVLDYDRSGSPEGRPGAGRAGKSI